MSKQGIFCLCALHNAIMRMKDAKELRGCEVVGNDLQSYILCVVLVLCNITHHHIKKTHWCRYIKRKEWLYAQMCWIIVARVVPASEAFCMQISLWEGAAVTPIKTRWPNFPLLFEQNSSASLPNYPQMSLKFNCYCVCQSSDGFYRVTKIN